MLILRRGLSDLPMGIVLQNTGTLMAATANLTGQLDDFRDQAVLALTTAWDVASGQAVLAPARLRLQDPHPVTDMTDSQATSRGTRKSRRQASTKTHSCVPFHALRPTSTTALPARANGCSSTASPKLHVRRKW